MGHPGLAAARRGKRIPWCAAHSKGGAPRGQARGAPVSRTRGPRPAALERSAGSGHIPPVDDNAHIQDPLADGPVPPHPPFILTRTIVLVGLMGAGKSSVGKRLAQRLHVPFIDADTEIESAAGCSIDQIFERHGEAAFRDGERRVIGRLLTENTPHVLATGGGAFMDPETRSRIKASALSVWLKADLDVLVRRVKKRNNRPLLKKGDPRDVLARLIDIRYPVYAEADLTVESIDGPHDRVVDDILAVVARAQGIEHG